MLNKLTSKIFNYIIYHWQWLFSIHQPTDIVNNFPDIKVGDFTGPASANPFSPIDQHHWNDGHVPLWLHTLVVIIEEPQDVVIHWWEHQACQGTATEKGI